MRVPLPLTKNTFLRLASGLLIVAALGGCAPITATPPASPTVPAATVPPPTPGPTVPPFDFRQVRIDIDAGDYQVKGMVPNHTIQLPWGGSPYGVTLHYPFPVKGYTIYPAIMDPRSTTWNLEIVQPPDANSLSFILSGASLGFFNVGVQVGDSRPVRFQVIVVGDGTPVPPPPTPAPISLGAYDRDLVSCPVMLPAQKPYVQVSMS